MPLPQATSPVLLGLLAAITWGAADFAGGLATRRAAPSQVVSIAHGTSLLLLAVASLRLPAHLPVWAVLSGLLSGVSGGVALMVFYKALSLGAMGLSAALAGLLTAVLPVLFAIRSEGLPGPLQLAGFGVAAASIVLIAYAPGAPGKAPARRTFLLAIVAGIGFGLQLISLHAASTARNLPNGSLSGAPGAVSGHPFAPVLRALLLSRLGGTGIALAALLAGPGRHARRKLSGPPETPEATLDAAASNKGDQHSAGLRLPRSRSLAGGAAPFAVAATAALAGLLDTGGNGLYMLSSISGRLDVAAVLSSLYPGATIVLAAVFLRERATWLQMLGMGCALVAVGLIAA